MVTNAIQLTLYVKHWCSDNVCHTHFRFCTRGKTAAHNCGGRGSEFGEYEYMRRWFVCVKMVIRMCLDGVVTMRVRGTYVG